MQRKPAHLDGSLVLSKGGWPGFRVRKQGHQGQMAGGTKQLHHMEVSGIEACEPIALLLSLLVSSPVLISPLKDPSH